jgi:hypothetical protein
VFSLLIGISQGKKYFGRPRKGWEDNIKINVVQTEFGIIRAIKSKKYKMGWTWSTHSYNILVGKPEGQRPIGRRRRMWEDNIKMDLREVGWESVDWMHLA